MLTGSRPEDQDELALLEVGALIEALVARHRDRASRESLVTEVQADSATLTAMAEELIAGAKHQLDVVIAADVTRAKPVYSALRALMSERGDTVGVRLLCVDSTLDREFVRSCLDRGLQLDARLARVSMLDAILADSQVALLSTGLSAEGRASLVRDTAVIQTLYTLFGGLWHGAVLVNSPADLGCRMPAEFPARVLGWLYAGVTDEVAARELCVSVRTYRRHVAEIMEMLGASSRFQAGGRAVEFGLLPAGPRSANNGDVGPGRVAQPHGTDRTTRAVGGRSVSGRAERTWADAALAGRGGGERMNALPTGLVPPGPNAKPQELSPRGDQGREQLLLRQR